MRRTDVGFGDDQEARVDERGAREVILLHATARPADAFWSDRLTIAATMYLLGMYLALADEHHPAVVKGLSDVAVPIVMVCPTRSSSPSASAPTARRPPPPGPRPDWDERGDVTGRQIARLRGDVELDLGVAALEQAQAANPAAASGAGNVVLGP